MLSKLTLETQAKKIVNEPLFKEYAQVARTDDNFRRLRAPQLTMRVPNSGMQEVLIIELSQDGKHVSLMERSNGIVHHVGYYPLSFFHETKQVAKNNEPIQAKATPKVEKPKRKYTRRTTTKRTTSRKKAE